MQHCSKACLRKIKNKQKSNFKMIKRVKTPNDLKDNISDTLAYTPHRPFSYYCVAVYRMYNFDV